MKILERAKARTKESTKATEKARVSGNLGGKERRGILPQVVLLTHPILRLDAESAALIRNQKDYAMIT